MHDLDHAGDSTALTFGRNSGSWALGEHPAVSVVIPVRNERRYIDACLAAIRHQTYPRAAIHVVIAEGTSTDGTSELIASRIADDPTITLLPNPGGRTAVGLNRAILASKGEVIC